MTFYQKLLFLLSSNQKRQIILLSFLLLFGVILEMFGLGLMLPILTLILTKDVGSEYPLIKPFLNFLGNPSQQQLVIGGMALLIAFYILKMFFILFLNWRQAIFTSHLSSELSQKLFTGYLKMPYAFHLQRNSSQLISNIQGEISIFTTVTQAAMSLQTELSIVLGVSAMLIYLEPLGATLVTFFLGISAFGFHRLTANKLLDWGGKRQKYDLQLNKDLMQGLNGVKDVKLLGREDYFLFKYGHSNIGKAYIATRQLTLLQFPRVYLELLAVIGMACLVIMMMVQNKPLEFLIPTLGIFVSAAFRMIPSLNRIMASTATIRYAQPVVNLIYDEFKIVDIEPALKVKQDINFLSEIRLESIVFKYQSVNSNALKGVSIVIKKGETIGFIGPSGSGKSTLVDVILGLLQPNSGSILIDGFDIQKNLRGWQDQIGYVPQSIYLTDDSIQSNIAFGVPVDQIDKSAVLGAIRAAQLNEFISSLPEGINTIVGERGVRLSGGQRQRIGIARALYNNPEILVMDEATSALDTGTESGVMQSITALKGIKTIVIVAHRLSTVENCDYLYRFENGRVVESGTPSQILGSSKVPLNP
jgi:ABC-type multidrug transport system fused ATPase/permease subunit